MGLVRGTMRGELGGDLQPIKEESGLAAIEATGGKGLEHLHEGELDAFGVHGEISSDTPPTGLCEERLCYQQVRGGVAR